MGNTQGGPSGRASQRRGLKDEKVPAMKGSGRGAVWEKAVVYTKMWRWKSKEASVDAVRDQERGHEPRGSLGGG